MDMMFQPSLSSSICFENPPKQARDDHLCERIPVIENWMMRPNPGKTPVSMNVENNHIDNLSSEMVPRSSSQLSTTSCPSKLYAPKYVYQRRTPQKQYVIASSGQTQISKESGTSSGVNQGTKSVTTRKGNAVPESQLEVCVSTTDNYSFKSNLYVGANPASNDMDVLLDMESPSNVSEKDFCISYLRSHGLQMHGHVRANDDVDATSWTSCSRSCKICGRSEAALNMLICDHCDNAFHSWCCHPHVSDIPIDEWFCKSCVKKKQKLLKEMKLLKLQRMAEATAGTIRVEASDDDLSCIDIMLLDTEPHKTEVRIGKGFQADVAEWSGPIPSDCGVAGEPLETEISESERLHNLGLQSSKRVHPIGNWLQCREVVRGLRKDIDGTVCGKWRRAPLHEVQTDDWDCFSAVLWDPAHADCAAPQEVETGEVLRQLKYMQMLKARLNGKRQKLSHPRSRG